MAQQSAYNVVVKRSAAVALALAPILFVQAPSAAIQERRSRWPSSREKGSYQAKVASSGKLLWQVQWETTVKQEQGRSQVEIHEQGQGQPWRMKEPVVWKKTLRFEEDPARTAGIEQPAMRVQSVEGSRWSADGRPMGEMSFSVNPSLQEILYNDSEAGKDPQSTVLPWNPHCIPDEMLFHWVRTLPFQDAVGQAQPSTECTLVVSPKRQVKIKAQIRGTEVVTTPAGTFSCYRVDLTPQLPGPLKALAPKMSLWCRTDPPNYWVRYQGPVGGPGSPEAVIELVEFKQETK